MSDPFDEIAEAAEPLMPEGGFDLPWTDEPVPYPEDEVTQVAATPDPVDEELDPLGKLVFDQRHQEDFDGLMFLGALQHEFSCFGHQIGIRTLTVDELLKVGLMTKRYEGSLGSDRAYITCIVALCVETVDGRPLVVPIGPKAHLEEEKFKFVRENWYFWTTDLIYQEFRALELRVEKLLAAMGEASG
jgi:hypothetical protein